ncbi:pilus assembly protein TadG-related protein [Gorillibacterium sp. sgz5001074]|uniref:pilus assembly protein TadG-related protein n=1 Tax=Gorillibacterium sp. sgz5001074 TaxID=3446695 RepID=UPI003F66AFEE
MKGLTVLGPWARRIQEAAGSEKGSTLAFAGLALTVLLAAAGLVTDGGTLFVTKTRLQKAADAAVLSAAQNLTLTEASVLQVAQEVLAKQDESASLRETSVVMGSKVGVRLAKEVRLGFSGLFGFRTATVEAKAAAELAVMGAATGAAPLGIDEAIQLTYYKEYKLKVDQTEVSSGNFGVLALGGTGSATYEDNMKYGYKNQLSVGDVIDTQTGNIAGKTRDSVQLRLDQCPYTPGDTSHRDCSRMILIPVYKPVEYGSNQLKRVQITGFATFYITQPMKSGDTYITGMFIKRADTGTAKPGAVNRGTYTIRLTE